MHFPAPTYLHSVLFGNVLLAKTCACRNPTAQSGARTPADARYSEWRTKQLYSAEVHSAELHSTDLYKSVNGYWRMIQLEL